MRHGVRKRRNFRSLLDEDSGWEAVHWAAIGDFRATDRTIMAWAKEHGYIVFTHDLDFGALLAATRAMGPSVIQVRTQKVLPEDIGETVAKSLRELRGELERGAMVSIDPGRARVRILPFHAA